MLIWKPTDARRQSYVNPHPTAVCLCVCVCVYAYVFVCVWVEKDCRRRLLGELCVAACLPGWNKTPIVASRSVGHLSPRRPRLHLLIQDHSAAWPNHSSTSGSGSEDISKYDTETPRSEELPAQTEAGGLRASREKNRWRTESH